MEFTSALEFKISSQQKLTYTTDANGYLETGSLPVASGYYFLKETKASPGYELDTSYWRIKVSDVTGGKNVKYTVVKFSDNSSTTLYNTTTTSPLTIDLTTESGRSYEPPANDPFGLQLSKLDADTEDGTAQGIASLEGAIFELAYYDNTDGKTDGEALRKWYFETKDNDGDGVAELNCRVESYLLPIKTLKSGEVIESDALYYGDDGVIYPVGTYVMKEITAPQYYQLEGKMTLEGIKDSVDVKEGLIYILKADPDTGDTRLYDLNGNPASGDNLISAENMLQLNVHDVVENESTIKVIKNEANSDTPIKGVTFKLVGLEEDVILTGTTDENGEIVFKDLIPQHYVLTEIETVDGKTLLEDNIEITLPLTMTEKEIENMGADIDAAKFDEATGMYCYYDLTYTIGNTIRLTFPKTGMSRTARIYIPLLCGLAIAGIASAFAFKKKKKKA